MAAVLRTCWLAVEHQYSHLDFLCGPFAKAPLCLVHRTGPECQAEGQEASYACLLGACKHTENVPICMWKRNPSVLRSAGGKTLNTPRSLPPGSCQSLLLFLYIFISNYSIVQNSQMYTNAQKLAKNDLMIHNRSPSRGPGVMQTEQNQGTPCLNR